ncbi:MAG: hypothetical protein A2Z32_09090 [Chloroflexi bacterium RBG_16_69_14]|nr:MAG: hypothetical protein A2Z32_09090 [Chloroflexi bacterium RBG_16_69_14]
MITVRPAGDDDADLAAIAAVVNAVSPDDPTSIEELRWAERTYPGGSRYIAEADDGHIVGAAIVGRIHIYAPDFDGLWATVQVLPDARRQGAGSRLLAAVSGHARERGKSALHIPVSEAAQEGVDFLVHRGFTEYSRSKSVRLELAGLPEPPIELPADFILTTLAERPDLVAGVHAVAVEAFTDIPVSDEPIAAGDLAEFRARDVDRANIPPDAFFVAVEAATGAVVGYASLILPPLAGPVTAWHDMTAVARPWRGRGLAGALKRATIGWAIRNGVAALETANDTDNAPMRAVNARLGYRPLPDYVTMRGPLFSGIIDA